MKTKKNILIVLTVLLFICQVQAEENYWLGFRSAPDRKTYMNNLTLEQLILMGRQCSEDAGKECPDTIFCERTTYALTFFFFTYIQKDGLKNIDALLQEIEDKSQPNFWRANLIVFLGSNDWLELMETEQLYPVIDRMLAVISDKNEHFRLRYEASKTARFVLEQLEGNNLLAEPVIQKKLKSESQLQDLKKEVIDGKITLSDNYKQAKVKKMKYHNSYAQTLLPVLNEPKMEPILQRGVLRGLQTSLDQKVDSAAQVHNALEDAVRNYNKFDKDYWGYLIQIGHKDLRLPDSNSIAQNMLSDMQGKFEAEKDKNKKNRIQSEIKSFERIIKQQELKKSDDPNAAEDKNKGKD